MCTIITKSIRSFAGQCSPEFWKLQIKNGSVIEEELTANQAKDLIEENGWEIIHKLDHNNMIWGDDRFKEECPETFRMFQYE